MTCPICNSPMSEPVAELFALPSVASDCRPWSKGRSVQICSGCGVMKRVTNTDFDHGVYKKYTSYPEPTGRTKKILDFVKDKMPAPKRVLDIGSGNGHGIRVINETYPDAKVFGYEPTIHAERPYQAFDLITLFHVFEHVEYLHEMLSYIKSSLTENGHVLIQVPYAVMWPFDLVIADHEWHFTIRSLIELFNKNGFETVDFVTKIIRKEITILAKVGKSVGIPLESHKQNPIEWLLAFKSKLDSINEPVAVYGTSVSAMWTGNILGHEKVYSYLDDDSSRWGEFNDKPVQHPEQCGLPVVAPFPDWQLPEIKAKNPHLIFL